MNVAPEGEQPQNWQEGQPLTWRWTVSPRRAGQQRLSINLTLHWRPESGRSLAGRQHTAFSRGLDVRVLGPLGLTRGQALGIGLAGLLLGVVLIIPSLGARRAAQAERGRPTGPERRGVTMRSSCINAG